MQSAALFDYEFIILIHQIFACRRQLHFMIILTTIVLMYVSKFIPNDNERRINTI